MMIVVLIALQSGAGGSHGADSALVRTLDGASHIYEVHMSVSADQSDSELDYRIGLFRSKDKDRAKPSDFDLRLSNFVLTADGVKSRRAIFGAGRMEVNSDGLPQVISQVGWYMAPLLSAYLPSDGRISTDIPIDEPFDKGWSVRGMVRLDLATADGQPIKIKAKLFSADAKSYEFASEALADVKTGWLRSAKGTIEGRSEIVQYTIREVSSDH